MISTLIAAEIWIYVQERMERMRSCTYIQLRISSACAPGTEQNKVMEKVVHVEVDFGRLYGRRGVLCGLLAAAVIATVICLAVFTAKHNEIGSFWPVDVCTLFLKQDDSTSGPISACQYVIGGSATVMVLLLALLIETLLVVFFAFAFAE